MVRGVSRREGGIPDFIQREFGIVARQPDPDTVEFLLLGSFIPATDLTRVGSLSDIQRLIGTSLNPILQQGVETLDVVNKNLFTGRPIETFPGEKGSFIGLAMSKNAINAARKIRVLALADKFLAPEDPNNPFRRKRFSIGERFLELGVGIRASQADPKKVAQSRLFESAKLAGAIKRATEKAKKLGDPAMLDYMKSLLEEADAATHNRRQR